MVTNISTYIAWSLSFISFRFVFIQLFPHFLLVMFICFFVFFLHAYPCFFLVFFPCYHSFFFFYLLIQPSDQQKIYHPWYHLPFTPPPSLEALVGCISALCSASVPHTLFNCYKQKQTKGRWGKETRSLGNRKAGRTGAKRKTAGD